MWKEYRIQFVNVNVCFVVHCTVIRWKQIYIVYGFIEICICILIVSYFINLINILIKDIRCIWKFKSLSTFAIFILIIIGF